MEKPKSSYSLEELITAAIRAANTLRDTSEWNTIDENELVKTAVDAVISHILFDSQRLRSQREQFGSKLTELVFVELPKVSRFLDELCIFYHYNKHLWVPDGFKSTDLGLLDGIGVVTFTYKSKPQASPLRNIRETDREKWIAEDLRHTLFRIADISIKDNGYGEKYITITDIFILRELVHYLEENLLPEDDKKHKPMLETANKSLAIVVTSLELAKQIVPILPQSSKLRKSLNTAISKLFDELAFNIPLHFNTIIIEGMQVRFRVEQQQTFSVTFEEFKDQYVNEKET